MFEDAQDFLQAARRIHKAGEVDRVALELVRLVSIDAPRDTAEWRERRVVRAGLQSELEHLKLAYAQHHAGSAEQAQEFRRRIRRSLQDMLASLLPGNVRPEFHERIEHIAEAAVSAVVGRRRGSDALRAAAREHADQPVAYASLNGSLFIPARAREFAEDFGVEGSALTSTIAEAAQPLRAACRANDVCRVGQLRFSHRPPGSNLLFRASLDLSTEDEHGPVIRVQLIDAAAEIHESPAGGLPRRDDARQGYSARLLRRFVS